MEILERQSERLRNIENALSTQKNVLNLDELTVFTGLSKSHIYKLTSAGKIPFYRQSKHLYFDRDEIESWLKSNRNKTGDEIEEEVSDLVSMRRRGGRK